MRRILMTTSALASLLAAAPVMAQSAEDGAANDDTIVVTARKREENLVDVPIPVSVATAAQLERDQVYSITDLQRVTPALEVSQTSGGEVNGGARLRGLGTGVFNASVSPSVAFVVDQVAQGNLTFPLLFDLAQVEVLRGPQGTLFGQGASAGVINVSTIAPTTNGVHVSGGIDAADKGTAGSGVSELTLRGAFNLPLGDNAALRVATQYRKETGLQRNSMLGLDNKIQDFGIRARLMFQPSETVKVNLSGEYTKNTMNGWNFFAIAVAPAGTAASAGSLAAFTGAPCNVPVINTRAEFYCEDTQAYMRNRAMGLSGVIEAELSDSLSLTSVTAYRTLDRETTTVNFSRRAGAAARNENIEGESKQFSQELRLDYKADKLDLVVGAMYSHFRTETTPIDDSIGFGNILLGKRTGFSVCFNSGVSPAPFLPNCFVPLAFTYELTKNNIFAMFADATYSLTDQVDLFGGIRYSTYKNTTGVGVDRLTASRTYEIKDNDISGRIGVSYKPDPETTFFLSYARGYKPPANVVPTLSTNPITYLRPEVADAVELGAKHQLGRLQLSANLFWSKVKDFQSQFSTFSGASLVSVTQNISKVESYGFELGAMGRIMDGLTINAGYQFNVVKWPTGFLGNDGLNLGGTQFINAPRHKLTISADYEYPVSDSINLFINGNTVYKSKVLLGQYGDPRYRYPAHAIINGSIGVRDADGRWTASIFARNLTKQREPTAYLASDQGGSSDGGIRAWPVAGLTARVVGISAAFNF